LRVLWSAEEARSLPGVSCCPPCLRGAELIETVPLARPSLLVAGRPKEVAPERTLPIRSPRTTPTLLARLTATHLRTHILPRRITTTSRFRPTVPSRHPRRRTRHPTRQPPAGHPTPNHLIPAVQQHPYTRLRRGTIFTIRRTASRRSTRVSASTLGCPGCR
jgi:hypothetical protein